MQKYGLNSFDVANAQKRIDIQKDYMSSSSFITSNGVSKTLFDISMAANISERYYAQLVNKVNTLQQAMTNLNLIPIFLTLTLDGWLHDLYYGNYARFNVSMLSKLPENDKYGYLATKAFNHEIFDTHDLYMVLRWQWEKFFSTRTFRNMRKESQIGYLFATEPHESGVPHAHVLLYVPASYVLKLKKEFVKVFDAPMNISQDKRRLSPEQIANGELNGFQWTISNPVGYILKYVTKSFMDIKNKAQIDELQAWYIKHRIVRFTTSHTLVPQWVYNKVYPLENDWLYLSDLKINSMCEWSAEDDYFKFEDTNMNKTLLYTKGLYQVFQDGELIREFGEMKEEKVKVNIERKHVSFKCNDKKEFHLNVYDENGELIYRRFRNTYVEVYKMPKVNLQKLSETQLLEYFYSLKNDFYNMHFRVTHNLCVKKGLIKGDILPLKLTTVFNEGVDELDELLNRKMMFSNLEARLDGVNF